MMNPIQKQGYLGDISSKSTAELTDLLSRQEAILRKTKFVESLPDKGAKVRGFYEKLQQLLSERTQQTDGILPARGGVSHHQVKSVPTGLRGDNPEQKLDNSELNQELQHSQPVTCGTTVSRNDNKSQLPGQEQNLVLPLSTTSPTQSQSDSSSDVEMKTNGTENVNPKTVPGSDLEGTFKKLQISEGEVSIQDRIQKEKTTNAYNKAIQNATEIHIPPKLNSALKNTDIAHLPREYKLKSRDHGKVLPVHVTPRALEESAATPPVYKHKESKLIPISESLSLQTTQKVKQEELQARYAAEKLSQRLCVTMEQYNPEGVDMSYRNQEQEVDSDDELE